MEHISNAINDLLVIYLKNSLNYQEIIKDKTFEWYEKNFKEAALIMNPIVKNNLIQSLSNSEDSRLAIIADELRKI